MVGLQREVLGLFLAAYDGNDANVQSISTFITHSIRHHVAHAQLPDVAVHQDELLMGVLSRNNVDLCRQAVLGIGLESLRATIAACEAQGCWFESAQLCLATSIVLGQVCRRGAQARERKSRCNWVCPLEPAGPLQVSVLASTL